MRKMENTSDHNRENNVCLWIAFIVGGVGFLVLTPFVSSIWLSFCLSFRPDKHHYSVCWSWQRPHQCKHPHTETGQLYLTPCTHLTVSMFSSDPSFSWLAEQFKVNKLFLMGKPGVNKQLHNIVHVYAYIHLKNKLQAGTHLLHKLRLHLFFYRPSSWLPFQKPIHLWYNADTTASLQ